MEFVNATPLTEYCRTHHSVDQRLKLFRSVCESVQHAQARAVIHCDLEPSNVLITADGAVKRLDF